MKQPMTPIRSAKRTKDRAIMAILLAVVLHLLIALIVYFTIFNKKPLAVTPTTVTHEYPIAAKSQSAISTVKNNDETGSGTNQANTGNETKKASTGKAVKVTQTKTVQKSAQKATQKPTSSTVTNTQSIKQSSAENLVVDLNTEKPLINLDNQSSTAEYKLNKTKEYDALEAEIEKDSEQLSQLIAEVKKRNQSQIQQHQNPTPNLQANTQNPILSDNDLPAQSDAPLPPISPISNTQTSLRTNLSETVIDPIEATK